MIAVLPITALGEGEMTACRVNGQEVLIANVDGSYYAVSNLCSHAGQRLSGGRLKGHRLHCPLHRAVFDVRTGAALSGPAQASLERFDVAIEGGRVLLDL